jgi:hypothetical protein
LLQATAPELHGKRAVMSHPGFLINPFVPDLCEMTAKKSAIFSLSFHTNQVQRDLSIIKNRVNREYSFSQKAWDD